MKRRFESYRFLVLGVCSCALTAGCSHQYGKFGADPGDSSLINEQFLINYAQTRRFSRGTPQSIKITPQNDVVLFLRSPSDNPVQDLYSFDIATGKQRVLLTADGILDGDTEALSAEELARRERMRMTARGIASYRLSRDGTRVLVPLSGDLYVIDRESGGVTQLPSDGGIPIDARFSPNGEFVACVRDGDLYIIDIAANSQRRLTHREGPHITNGESEFVAQEEMSRFAGYWWSPDSTRIAYQQTDTSMLETMHIGDALRPGDEPHSWPYPRPGKKNAGVRLGVIDASGGDTTWIDWDHEAYEYLATVRWQENAPLTLVVQNRKQTELAILTADIDSGTTQSIHVERDASWINLDQSMPHWIPSRGTFLWATERYGDWALEERRPNDSDPVIVAPNQTANFRGFISIDDEGRKLAIYVDRPGPPAGHPTERYVAELTYDPSTGQWSQPHIESVEERTGTPAIESAVYSRDHGTRVLSSKSMDRESAYVVTDASGKSIGELESTAATPNLEPNVELVTVESGDRTYYAAIIRPREFSALKRYPVIDSVYGGPGHPVVSVSSAGYLFDQWLADQGFIVVRIDGRGTPNRGRAWERAIKGNFIHEPLNDHVAALAALGERYHEMDMTRVGVYGWSFGGYFSAMAVMQQPDVYHAGVAGAPVCDWTDYDTHYTERYISLPADNPGGYQYSSVLQYADQLRRPLMLIHGTTDDNVYFTHSLKISDALFRGGIDHRFVPLSNFTHMVADPVVAVRVNEAIVRFMHECLGQPM